MALSIENLPLSFALIIIAGIAAFVILAWLFFKYRSERKPSDPVYRSIAIGAFIIFVIVMLDFFDVFGQPGESWLAQETAGIPNASVIILIVLLVFIAAYMYVRRSKTLDLEKQFRAGAKHVQMLGHGIKVYDHTDPSNSLPFDFVKMLKSKEKESERITDIVGEMLLNLNDDTKILVTVDSYTGKALSIETNPRLERLRPLQKKPPVVSMDLERQEVDKGLSGASRAMTTPGEAHA